MARLSACFAVFVVRFCSTFAFGAPQGNKTYDLVAVDLQLVTVKGIPKGTNTAEALNQITKRLNKGSPIPPRETCPESPDPVANVICPECPQPKCPDLTDNGNNLQGKANFTCPECPAEVTNVSCPEPITCPVHPAEVTNVSCPESIMCPECPAEVTTVSSPEPVTCPECPAEMTTVSCPEPVTCPECPAEVTTISCPEPVTCPECPAEVTTVSCPEPVTCPECPAEMTTVSCPEPVTCPECPAEITTISCPEPVTCPECPAEITTISCPEPVTCPECPAEVSTVSCPEPVTCPEYPEPTTRSEELTSLPVDCYEYRKRGFVESGIYKIHPLHYSIEGPIEVLCDMETDGGGWTVFQRRGDFGEPKQDFYHNWADYKKGFGDLKREFWLGNHYLFVLTNQKRVSLRVDLEDWEGEKRYATYEDFVVRSEEEKYKLTFGKYAGNAGDPLTAKSLNMSFSTKDRDNDVWNMHCAQFCKSGWWFRSCFGVNLNGVYVRRGQSGNKVEQSKGLVWFTWKGNWYSLKGSEMKIRPLVAPDR